MSKFITKSIAPAAISLGLAGGLLGASIGTAAAATKPKPKPKTHTTKTVAASLKASGIVTAVDAKTDELTVKVGKTSDVFKTTTKTVVRFAGKKAALAGLKAGEHVVVVYTTAGKVLDASSVLASKA